GLKAGERVLDLGCGTGFWTLPLAEKVGASGVVTALDVSQELLDDLAASHPPAQVHLLHSELPMIELPDGSVDFEWVAFVTHEVHPLVTLTREMRRVGKRAAVLDWRPDAVGGKGPPRDHRLTPQQTIDALLAGGFTTALQTWQDDDNYLIEATA
ncbi:MAG TPA: methyltransferase domain-containing protein, partial [Anaerolineae bacterium]